MAARQVARPAGLALAALLWTLVCGVGTAAADVAAGGPELRVSGGFDVAAHDRWDFVRFDVRHDGKAALTARLTLTRESGAVQAWERSVPPLKPWSESRYDYAGGTDRVASARLDVGGASTTWRRPARIPPRKLVVIVTGDDGRALPVSTLLSARKGLGLERARPDALPDRWAAWRKVTAVLSWADELPARATAEGQALRDYIRAGGTLLLYAGDGGGDLLADVEEEEDSSDMRFGRGQVLRMGRGGHLRPPELVGAPTPPKNAPMLVAAPPDPPVDWLLARVGWFVPLMLLVMMALRRRPALGALTLALTMLGALVGSPPPSAAPAKVREARWEDGAGYRRQELAMTPGRTGALILPSDAASSVVALDPSAAISLTLDSEGTLTTPARWGEPVELLVETLARAD